MARQTFGVAFGVLTALACSGVRAQAPEGGERITLQEVIVTAQKRAESLQEVPISIAAIGEQQLEELGIRSLKDFAGNVPNLFINNFNARPDTVRLFIRGVGQNDVSITQDPSVALYLDGVYIGTSVGAAIESADVERIEVLRGPQGTLYGRNSTGGAVNLIAKKPALGSIGGDLSLSGGNFDYRRASGAVNFGGEKLALRLSGLYTERDGWIANDGPGEDFGSWDRQAMRAALRWQPGEAFTADYAFDLSKIKDSGTLTYSTAGAGNSAALLGAPFQLQTPNGPLLVAPYGVWNYTNHPFTAKRPSRVTSPRPVLPNDSEVQGHALTLEWVANEALTFRSITGAREVESRLFADNLPLFSGNIGLYTVTLPTLQPGALIQPLGGPFPATEARDAFTYETLSQEFQVLGDVRLGGGGGLRYVAGLYYYEDEGDFLRNSNNLGPRALDYSQVENESYAVFGDLTWTPAFAGERLHLTAGGRWAKDKRQAFRINENSFSFAAVGGFTAADCQRFASTFAALGQACVPTGATVGVNYADEFTNFTPSFTARYDISSDMNVYLRFVEGFKSGGTSQRSANPLNFTRGFLPEEVTSWELGLKGSFLDRRLTLSTAVFYMEIDKYQASLQTGGTAGDRDFFPIDGNKVKGLEAELAAALTQNLRARLSVGLLDTKFGEKQTSILLDTGQQLTTNFVERFSYAPDESFTAGLDYNRSLGSQWQFGSFLSYNYQGNMETSSNLADNLQLQSRGLVDAGVSFTRAGLGGLGDMTLRLWGKNLTDKEYYNLHFSSFAFFGSAAVAEYGEPRTYGVTVSFNF
jgi:iron complex outermembrane recepter protein